jgi:hypothetical protein
VLWIGYLQWHFRTRGAGLPPSPILRDFRNIECRDAVLDHDAAKSSPTKHGVPLSRWDGAPLKTHPSPANRCPTTTPACPCCATSTRAGHLAGGRLHRRQPALHRRRHHARRLGDGYVEALRGLAGSPESADFVMFWWHHAAALVARAVQRFGFITTNSLKQTFNRRVVQQAIDNGCTSPSPSRPPVGGRADGAAVRIAMTVGRPGEGRALLTS